LLGGAWWGVPRIIPQEARISELEELSFNDEPRELLSPLRPLRTANSEYAEITNVGELTERRAVLDA
jgi:hypothetical protein